MKKFLVIIVTGLTLVSCTKEVSPSLPAAAHQTLFFTSANVSVENIHAVSTAPTTVTVSFSTSFENNITKIELMSSTDQNTFCAIQSATVSGNSSGKKDYSFSDANVKGSTMYYMLRFQDSNGNWTYSPYLTVQVN